jgi:hypothetical protein
VTPDEVQALVGAAIARALEPLTARIATLESARTEARPLLTVREACARFGFSRATLNRWVADPRCGLDGRPEPIVVRPNGPGGKVLVHAVRMQAWLDAGGARARPRLLRGRPA